MKKRTLHGRWIPPSARPTCKGFQKTKNTLNLILREKGQNNQKVTRETWGKKIYRYRVYKLGVGVVSRKITEINSDHSSDPE